MAGIERDAERQLKPGTAKSVVTQFFTEHGIHFAILESEIVGELNTSGCSPLGCGSDAFTILVHVKTDESGFVKEVPKVSGLYTNCL